MTGRGYRCRVPRLRRHLALVALARAFKPGSPGMGRRLAALPRLIRASIRGEYDAGTRLLMMAAASLYILSPLDAIPELFTAFIGLVDDAFVATWLAGALLAETERFLEWEEGRPVARPTVVPGRIVKR
jgi:uncharacterized membrane protein YkvA (DUF1232 family)